MFTASYDSNAVQQVVFRQTAAYTARLRVQKQAAPPSTHAVVSCRKMLPGLLDPDLFYFFDQQHTTVQTNL